MIKQHTVNNFKTLKDRSYIDKGSWNNRRRTAWNDAHRGSKKNERTYF